MGGIAIGAWIASQNSHKIKNLLLGYAIVEGIIGLFALFFHFTFVNATQWAHFSIIPEIGSLAWVNVFKWTLALLLILPQSILLGMTFPLMSAGIMRRFPATPGASIAILYFSNSLGAATGVLISGFVLISQVGLPSTVLTAGLINILLALVVWGLCRQDVYRQPVSSTTTSKTTFNTLYLVFLLCAALTGFASFLYEIAWIRMLSMVLGSSTHSFELMLSAFILGLAIGGLWIKRHIETLSSPIKTLGLVQIVMGVFALLTLISYNYLFELMSFILRALSTTEQGYILFNLSSHAIALLVMLPATICAGMTLPLLTYYLIKKDHGEKAIGHIYAANTLGAIIGIIIGVQWIMPQWGVKNLITIGATIDILLGLGLLWYVSQTFSRIRWAVTVGIAITWIIVNTLWVELDPGRMSSGVYRYAKIYNEITDNISLFHKDGKTASIDLFYDNYLKNKIVISTNGKPDAGIGINHPSSDEITMILLAALPLAIHNNPKYVANIGFGSGLTVNTLLHDPRIKQVNTIEIESAMVEAARGYGKSVEKAYIDPRSHIHIEDAKTFFTNYQKKYDVIISEPSNP